MSTTRTGTISRRSFGRLAGAGVASLALPTYLRAQDKPRVVIVGGGAGGATAARYVAKDSKGAIDVTLIEDSDTFTTCFFSNLYLGGYRDFASITHGYDALVSAYGIRKVTGMAMAVDRAAKTVTMADGAVVPYDRLVLSPASTSSTIPCRAIRKRPLRRRRMPGRPARRRNASRPGSMR